MLPPTVLYPQGADCLIILFDLRFREAVERLHFERAFWQGDADLEAIDADHLALVIRGDRASVRSA
jgi:hypothetical protein